MRDDFDFDRLVDLCRRTHEETRGSAVRVVDRSLVVRNWLFGWYIVEYQRNGVDRAKYGAQTIKKPSAGLKERIGWGSSVRSLELFRRFFLQVGKPLQDAVVTHTSTADSVNLRIPQSSIAKSSASRGELSRVLRSASTALLQHFTLGRTTSSCCRLPIQMPDDSLKSRLRRTDGPSASRRQLDSSLYERLAVSRDKHEVRRLAREGQVVEKAADLIKDPVVLDGESVEATRAGRPAEWRSVRHSMSCLFP